MSEEIRYLIEQMMLTAENNGDDYPNAFAAAASAAQELKRHFKESEVSLCFSMCWLIAEMLRQKDGSGWK